MGAPTAEEAVSSSGTGALNSATAGSGEAFSHTILPRRKGVADRSRFGDTCDRFLNLQLWVGVVPLLPCRLSHRQYLSSV